MSNHVLNWGIEDPVVQTGESDGESHNSVDPVTISNGNDMDVNTNVTPCNDKISQFCLFEQSNCYIDSNGLTAVSASAMPIFNELYPECSGTSDLSQINKPLNMNNGYFNPKSSNFLGGANMRQSIMVIMAIAILLVVSKGQPIKATAKAVKKAV